jgi:hypothetical protein
MSRKGIPDRRARVRSPAMGFRLRLLVLAFWATWLSVVTATNVTDALRVARLLPQSFAFASSNFELVETTTAIYHAPRGLVWLLFAGVVAWETAAAALFWRALAAARRVGAGDAAPLEGSMTLAFVAAMGLFAAFMVADEALIAYPLQGGHMRAFTALGVSWLVARPPSR